MLDIIFTSQFKKDLKKAKRQGRNIDLLYDVINKLANEKQLNKKFRDHALSGKYEGYRDCHIEFDWVLVYKIESSELVLLLARIGSHSEVLDL
ncbi:MAG: type II toxin-antitoxin system YafQ family toxin [Coriobacteriia bacterium]|nr:type II toxin-antitoxin system YafQ family toxin [Coriobacteriia bacterium]